MIKSRTGTIAVVISPSPFQFILLGYVKFLHVNPIFKAIRITAMKHYVLAGGVHVIVPVANENESRVVDTYPSAVCFVLRIYLAEVFTVLIVDLLNRLVYSSKF